MRPQCQPKRDGACESGLMPCGGGRNRLARPMHKSCTFHAHEMRSGAGLTRRTVVVAFWCGGGLPGLGVFGAGPGGAGAGCCTALGGRAARMGLTRWGITCGDMVREGKTGE